MSWMLLNFDPDQRMAKISEWVMTIRRFGKIDFVGPGSAIY